MANDDGPIDLTAGGIENSDKFSHIEKARLLMVVMLSGSVTFSSEVQLLKTVSGTVMTPSGIEIDVSEVQLLKTFLPSDVTVVGIVMSLSAEQSEKRESSRTVMVDGR